MIEFTVPGNPLPKKRPRVNTHTRRAYSDPRSVVWEQTVAQYAMLAMVGQDALPGEVEVELTFRRASRHRVNIDNLCKAILDGMNGVVFGDDFQVRRLVATLDKACPEPGVDVVVR